MRPMIAISVVFLFLLPVLLWRLGYKWTLAIGIVVDDALPHRLVGDLHQAPRRG